MSGPGTKGSGTNTALGLMAVSATLFAFMNFFARVATASASWASTAAVRSIVGALVAFAVARVRGTSLAGKDRSAIFWRSVLGTISMMATFYAVSSHTVSLGNTVTLVNLAPVFLAVLAPIFLGERTTGVVAFAIALALGGVTLVARPTFLFGAGALATLPLGATPLASATVIAAGPSPAVTTISAIAASLATSTAMMMLRRAGQTETAEAISFHFAVFAAILTSAIALFDFHVPAPRDAGFMVAAGLCGGVAQLTMSRAYAREQAARVGGMSYLSPVVSAVLGATLLHERPGPGAIAGMALVITAGLLVTFIGPRTPARLRA